jgi:hypothetical protein
VHSRRFEEHFQLGECVLPFSSDVVPSHLLFKALIEITGIEVKLWFRIQGKLRSNLVWDARYTHRYRALAPAGFPPRQLGFVPRSAHVGFVVAQVALVQVYSEYFGFSCQFSFHRLLDTHLSSEADIIGQLVADVPS